MFFRRPVRVLFICSENICRSAMAEGMLRQRLREAGLHRRVRVSSAGTRVSQPGHRPDVRARRVVAGAGARLSGIKSRQVQPGDLERSDRVLAMEASHLGALREICPPGHEHKLALVLDCVPELGVEGVPDPYYGNRESFDRVFELLSAALDGLVEQLKAAP